MNVPWLVSTQSEKLLSLANNHRSMNKAILYGLGLILLSSFCYGEIYQWRDKKGNLHFGDRPPIDVDNHEVKVKINSYDTVEVIDGSAWAEQRNQKNKNRKKNSKQIIMYSTQWCIACKKAKKYFRKNRIPFQEYDVEHSEKGKRDYASLNGGGVPIIMIGKKRMNGFSASYFEAIYYKAAKQKK